MEKMKLYDELVWRGLIKDTAGEDLKDKINEGGMTFYIGADPTAESLHIGQYPTFLVAERLRRGGHHPIILVGGATGLVGDPRGTGERDKADPKIIEHNFGMISKQMKKLFGEETLVVNNYEWFKDYHYIDFLRDVGKCINVNYMINKDLVKRQMEVGISYAEFSYMLIQGYDYKVLHDKYGATLQFGGSDQWGNLTTGIEIIRKLEGEEVYAFSVPLITDSTGKKLGKSYGNALWLDINKTSSYEMYQYIINFEDCMIEEYLKKYTFLSPDEIMAIMKQHEKTPELRIAQKRLAECVITDLHGKEEFDKAKRISEALFSEDITSLSSKDILDSLKGVKEVSLTEGNIIDVLTTSGVFTSKREAREMVSGNALSINNKKINDLEYILSSKDLIDHQIIVIRKGKKNYYIGKLN